MLILLSNISSTARQINNINKIIMSYIQPGNGSSKAFPGKTAPLDDAISRHSSASSEGRNNPLQAKKHDPLPPHISSSSISSNSSLSTTTHAAHHGMIQLCENDGVEESMNALHGQVKINENLSKPEKEQAGEAIKESKNWFSKHKNLIIGAFIALGLAVIAISCAFLPGVGPLISFIVLGAGLPFAFAFVLIPIPEDTKNEEKSEPSKQTTNTQTDNKPQTQKPNQKTTNTHIDNESRQEGYPKQRKLEEYEETQTYPKVISSPDSHIPKISDSAALYESSDHSETQHRDHHHHYTGLSTPSELNADTSGNQSYYPISNSYHAAATGNITPSTDSSKQSINRSFTPSTEATSDASIYGAKRKNKDTDKYDDNNPLSQQQSRQQPLPKPSEQETVKLRHATPNSPYKNQHVTLPEVKLQKHQQGEHENAYPNENSLATPAKTQPKDRPLTTQTTPSSSTQGFDEHNTRTKPYDNSKTQPFSQQISHQQPRQQPLPKPSEQETVELRHATPNSPYKNQHVTLPEVKPRKYQRGEDKNVHPNENSLAVPANGERKTPTKPHDNNNKTEPFSQQISHQQPRQQPLPKPSEQETVELRHATPNSPYKNQHVTLPEVKPRKYQRGEDKNVHPNENSLATPAKTQPKDRPLTTQTTPSSYSLTQGFDEHNTRTKPYDNSKTQPFSQQISHQQPRQQPLPKPSEQETVELRHATPNSPYKNQHVTLPEVKPRKYQRGEDKNVHPNENSLAVPANGERKTRTKPYDNSKTQPFSQQISHQQPRQQPLPKPSEQETVELRHATPNSPYKNQHVTLPEVKPRKYQRGEDKNVHPNENSLAVPANGYRQSTSFEQSEQGRVKRGSDSQSATSAIQTITFAHPSTQNLHDKSQQIQMPQASSTSLKSQYHFRPKNNTQVRVMRIPTQTTVATANSEKKPKHTIANEVFAQLCNSMGTNTGTIIDFANDKAELDLEKLTNSKVWQSNNSSQTPILRVADITQTKKITPITNSVSTKRYTSHNSATKIQQSSQSTRNYSDVNNNSLFEDQITQGVNMEDSELKRLALSLKHAEKYTVPSSDHFEQQYKEITVNEEVLSSSSSYSWDEAGPLIELLSFDSSVYVDRNITDVDDAKQATATNNTKKLLNNIDQSLNRQHFSFALNSEEATSIMELDLDAPEKKLIHMGARNIVRKVLAESASDYYSSGIIYNYQIDKINICKAARSKLNAICKNMRAYPAFKLIQKNINTLFDDTTKNLP